MILKFKHKLRALILILILISSYCYGLTDQQIKNVQQTIDLLQQKNYQDYLIVKNENNITDQKTKTYINYKEISLHPDKFSQQQIQQFFKAHKDEYWASELCDDLAIYYAKTKNWKMFEKYYDGDLQTVGQCWVADNQSKVDKNKAIKDFAKYWQKNKFNAPECVGLDKDIKKYTPKEKQCILDKAHNLALSNDFNDSSKLLAKYVKQDQEYANYINQWKYVTYNLSVNNLDGFIKKYHEYPKFTDVILDIASDNVKIDALKYAKVWQKLRYRKLLSYQVQQQIDEKIGVALAQNHDSNAKQWLWKIDKKHISKVAEDWILRVDLYNSNYSGYIEDYLNSSKQVQQEKVWKYWLAYSYQKIGMPDKAQPIYIELAKIPYNYYSYLSADALGINYSYGDNNFSGISYSEIQKLESDENVKHAIELHKMGQFKDSVKLWKWIVRKKFSDGYRNEIPLLAQLAWLYEMYYQAIFSMHVMGLDNHVHLLYPDAFDEIVQEQSSKYDLKQALIYSIMRKESLFEIEAKSYVGAKGLMQVTVPTVNFISDKYRLGYNINNSSDEIFDPYINIKIGSANLDFLDSLFKSNLVLAIAAYNAGPGNVNKWLSDKQIPVKQWIENIPFGETRHYVRKVLVNMIVYNNVILKDNKKLRLSDLLNTNVSNEFDFRK
ncbi:lytic transglycosylase domain-containing protein [Francisella philomiragia]|uniref:lytic transglycosylase domain-containing protein n=1 Tax=Francisella philomiragia TaxID=28110 RepID=UPI001C9E1A89|nr:lytic transglycosylase domain-containing protein [Francisella philomiragia]MBY7735238.1 lytic transglycosylase domain-containing protein [Francisella philomiragia]